MKNIETLKEKAKAILAKKDTYASDDFKNSDFNTLLHEIDVYSAELEAQNNELLEKESILLKTLNMNQVIYEQAPIAYLCLDEHLNITSANKIAHETFDFSIINKTYDFFYKYIAKGSLNSFMYWLNSKKYETCPLELDLISRSEIKRFRIFLKNPKEAQSFFLLNLIDINEEFLLRKQEKAHAQILQEIAQFQSNMLIILDKNNKLKFSNKSFLDFFQIKDIFEFEEKYTSICANFKVKDNFFHTKNKKNKDWINNFSKSKSNEKVVCLYDIANNCEKYFIINISQTFLEDTICTFSEITDLSLEKEHYKNKAYMDELTNIYNRAKLNKELKKYFDNYTINENPLIITMFDIDFFKKVNDTHGHDIGDKVLIQLTELVSKNIRKTDIFARWGGEEFIILFEACDKKKAIQLSEYIRKKVQEFTFSNDVKITCSFGITQQNKEDTIQTFTKRVDDALYEAKQSGRNRVVWHNDR